MAVVSKVAQEKIALDVYDKKLIFLLSQNSRMPITKIASTLKISSQRAQYKIERLKKEILEPAPFMNFPLLGIPSYIIYMQQLEEREIEKIMESKEIYFLMQSLGKYQWVLNVVTETIENFCETYLGEKQFDIYPIIRSIPDDYNPFHVNIEPLPLRKNISTTLDEKDYVLLTHLARRPIDSFSSIHAATSIDRKTIKKKMQQFESCNIIQKFRYGINIFKIGHIAYILKIKVTSLQKKKVLAFIRNNHYSGFVFESYNLFTMHYLPPSHNEILQFTKELQTIAPSSEIDVIQNTEFFKVALVPDVVPEIFKKRMKQKNAISK